MTLRIFYFLTLLLVTTLTGCTDVAVSGAQAAYNHHSVRKTFTDHYIAYEAYKKIDEEGSEFKNTHIIITAFNNDVLLAGQTPEEEQRKKVEQLVREIPQVDEVHNLITIGSPSSALTRVSDAWITTKIKSKLMVLDDVDATEVKVMTENGTVYLMGVIRPSEAQAAVDVASRTDGVSRVVKVFRYLRLCKA